MCARGERSYIPSYYYTTTHFTAFAARKRIMYLALPLLILLDLKLGSEVGLRRRCGGERGT